MKMHCQICSSPNFSCAKTIIEKVTTEPRDGNVHDDYDYDCLDASKLHCVGDGGGKVETFNHVEHNLYKQSPEPISPPTNPDGKMHPEKKADGEAG